MARPQAPGFRLGARQGAGNQARGRGLRNSPCRACEAQEPLDCGAGPEDLTQGLVSSQSRACVPAQGWGCTHRGPIQRGRLGGTADVGSSPRVAVGP